MIEDRIKKIAKELLDAVENKSLVDQCKDEIKVLIKEFAASGETLLESFYKIWKSSSSCGTSNKINSWLAYAIGMTSGKPTGDFLPSRRIFARAGFPDIDVDFEYERRGEIYDYIIDKYGRENVGNIGTYNSLKFKSFITRAVKALDLAGSFSKGKDEYVKDNNALVRQIIDSLPEQKGAFIKVRGEDGKQVVVKNFMDAYNNCKEFRGHIDKYPELIEYAKTLEGLLSSYGVHAAGIVVSDTPLASIAPMRLAKTKKDGTRDLATQYANEDLEYLGLIKFDILALSTLSVVSLALKYIKKFENIDIDIENLPLDDDKTFELYRSGNLIGVFQCEERGMQKTMQEIGVDSFNDIVAGIALFRPGPMASIPKYCARKHGQEHVDYYSPEIEPFVKPYLEDTYGILSYQEQIMQICNSLAGLTITDGYVIIKAVGKKKEDLLRKYRLKFIDGCENNGVGRRIATEYWDKFITPFAAYGFNKCLDGSTEVVDCRLNKTYTLEDLSKRYKKECIDNIYLHSLDQGEVVEDKIVDVFCTGEKEVYEVEFDDGSIAKCTLDHKFMCDDGEFRTVKNIVKDNLSVTQYFMEELRSTEVNKKLKIKSIKKIGTRKTYNITMNSDQHNYFISTGSNRSIVTKNSHSACYGVLSYQTAYLKAHYPDLFMMAYLNVECRNKKYEKVEHLEREVSRMGIEIGKRHINKCELDYELVKTELPNGISISRITPSIMCKGLATTAAESIVKNKPYKSLEDFAIRTDSASVDSEAFSSLMAAGIIKQDESSLNKFNQFRSHLKKVRKKGYQGMDLFG